MRLEKVRISSFLQSLCHLTVQDEYTLHFEFSEFITQGDDKVVKEATEYIRKRGSQSCHRRAYSKCRSNFPYAVFL